ncbi:MAG: PmoA family protein [Planctomycetes bacterium]|nr:PmoA family protein [Planctomycetota bacterium]
MKSTTFITSVAIIALFLSMFGVNASAEQVQIELSAPKADCLDVPVTCAVELPGALARVDAGQLSVSVRQDGQPGDICGQIVRTPDGKAKLCWVAPKIAAGKSTSWTATVSKGKADAGFSWKDNSGEYLDLLFDGSKVTRYMYAYDKSTPKRLHETYKVFHHVFDADGKNVITKGPDGETPYEQGLYTHHRGIFIGWRKVKHQGQEYDFWHMKGVFLVHQKFQQMVAGPVLGSSTAVINWIDKKGAAVIQEQRTTTVFRQSDPTILLLEFETNLKAVNGDVILDGDPEHAGFQYRPHNDVASGPADVKARYLFHKDGIDAHKDQNLPWVAMSYGLNGKRYSVLHMSHPDNPKPSVYSAYRDYGRFGEFFKDEIKDGQTLNLKYRILVVPGDLPRRNEMAARYLSFVDGPKVNKVVWKSQSDTSGTGAATKMAPLPIVLPKPMFVGTPTNIKVPNLMKGTGKPRPPFYAPVGCVNLAAGKVVGSTDDLPIIGDIEMITDGDKEAADGSYVELGPFQQHITVDLGQECEVYAVLVWHYHKQARVYFDVIVQTADDADFISNVKTLFNNDIDNSAGLGIGADMHYIETSDGKLIDGKGTKARFVRLYSNGSNANDLNNYIEVEIWGKPAK